MFNRRKKLAASNNDDIQITQNEIIDDRQEWEEFITEAKDKQPFLPETASGRSDGADDLRPVELTQQPEDISSESADIFEHGMPDISSFPAMRIAYGLDRTEEVSYSDRESGEEEPDEEEKRERLFRVYADMEETEPIDNVQAESAEDLPALFQIESAPVQDGTESSDDEEEPQAEPEEFTMESEIAKQRQISGELFEYIGVIEQGARSLVRQREIDRAKAGQPKLYDPYNAGFNSRYDDTDRILEETPEIPIEPKIRMDEDSEDN